MKIALVGNQNSGKTTLFNALTGSNQKIGNWPGVTIERKSGVIRGTDFEVVDLPGIYSLSPYTAEEEVSRRYVFEELPDVIINILDATSIERSLYLTTQLLEMDSDVIVALNMADIMEKKGVKIDVDKLSAELGASVFVISALKNTGIAEMVAAIKSGEYIRNNTVKIFKPVLEEKIASVEGRIKSPHPRFAAVKLLERDKLFADEISIDLSAEIKAIEDEFKSDIEEIVANGRYDYITGVRDRCVTLTPVPETATDKLDKVFLNKWAALPIFAVIMFAVYYVSVGVVGSFTVEWVDGMVGRFGEWFGVKLSDWGASDWSASLVVDGIVAGVGAVLNFVPQLIMLFLCISLLETSGYMSRIAFLMDKIFKKFGLSGKALIPFIVGSGCSVPGIMTTRTIEDEQERKMSVLLTPFMPCSAKLPIIALFAGAFFPDNSGLVSASLYLFAIAVILVSAVLLKKFYFKGGSTAFISELPAYKVPSPKYVLRDVFDKTAEFVKRAGTIILLASVIVWFLLSFNWRLQYGIDIEKSILAGVGKAFSWVFYPMLGELSWGATVSAVQGLVAKEQVVSSMSIIAGLSEEGGIEMFTSGIFGFFSKPSAYAFMVFNLFSAPCFGALGAMKREFGFTKSMLAAAGFQTVVAWVLACLVNGIGSLLEVIF